MIDVSHTDTGTTAAALLGPTLSKYFPFSSFNGVQLRCAPTLLNNDISVVVSAPTGSGKTILFELAIIRLFKDRLLLGQHQQIVAERGKLKAIYICPVKALAAEKHEAWSKRFAPALSVHVETGDSGSSGADLEAVSAADIVVTTPERWDAITRKWKDTTSLALVSSVGLVLIDEVHLVNESRGAVLEALVSRMKTVKAVLAATVVNEAVVKPPVASLRFVAVSGTIPNIADVAEWLHAPSEGVFQFAESERPVPLSIKVAGFHANSKNPFGFDRFLNFKLLGIIQQFSGGKPTLVFCSSRRDTVNTAVHLSSELQEKFGLQQGPDDTELRDLAQTVDDSQLKKCLPAGVGYHHAALSHKDRRLVEDLFLQQKILVVCTTTTLSVGVNLPARLVVVKGTQFFKNGGIREDLPLTDVAQMAGRAGRPGFDTEGVAVIVTSEDKVPKYMPLQQQTRPGGSIAATVVESQLHTHMVEHLNAEVALRTVHTMAMGPEWLKTTFLWIRLHRNPSNYFGSCASINLPSTAIEDSSSDRHSATTENFAVALVASLLLKLLNERCIVARRIHDANQDSRVASLENIPLSAPADEGPVIDFTAGLSAGGSGAVTDGSSMLEGDCAEFAKFLKSDLKFHSNYRAKWSLECTRVGRALARLYVEFDTVCLFNRKLLHLTSSVTPVGGLPSSQDQAGEEEKNGDDDPQLDGRGGEEAQDDDDSNGGDNNTGRFGGLGYSVPKLLGVLCQSGELSECRLRLGDKGHLNASNKMLKFPINNGNKGGREVRETWQKVFVITQTILSDDGKIDDWSLRNDAARVLHSLPRLAKFLVDYVSAYCRYSSVYDQDKTAPGGVAIVGAAAAAAATEGNRKKCKYFTGETLRNAFMLQRCIEKKQWWDSAVLTKQLDGIGDTLSRSLSRGGVRTISDILAADPRRLEALCIKHPPFGSELQAKCREIPRYSLTCHQQQSDQKNGAGQTHRGDKKKIFIVKLHPLVDSTVKCRAQFFTLLACQESNGEILLLRRFRSTNGESALNSRQFDFSFVPVAGTNNKSSSLQMGRQTTVHVSLICENLLGNDSSVVATVAAATPPAAAPLVTKQQHQNLDFNSKKEEKPQRPVFQSTLFPFKPILTSNSNNTTATAVQHARSISSEEEEDEEDTTSEKKGTTTTTVQQRQNGNEPLETSANNGNARLIVSQVTSNLRQQQTTTSNKLTLFAPPPPPPVATVDNPEPAHEERNRPEQPLVDVPQRVASAGDSSAPQWIKDKQHYLSNFLLEVKQSRLIGRKRSRSCPPAASGHEVSSRQSRSSASVSTGSAANPLPEHAIGKKRIRLPNSPQPQDPLAPETNSTANGQHYYNNSCCDAIGFEQQQHRCQQEGSILLQQQQPMPCYSRAAPMSMAAFSIFGGSDAPRSKDLQLLAPPSMLPSVKRRQQQGGGRGRTQQQQQQPYQRLNPPSSSGMNGDALSTLRTAVASQTCRVKELQQQQSYQVAASSNNDASALVWRAQPFDATNGVELGAAAAPSFSFDPAATFTNHSNPPATLGPFQAMQQHLLRGDSNAFFSTLQGPPQFFNYYSSSQPQPYYYPPTSPFGAPTQQQQQFFQQPTTQQQQQQQLAYLAHQQHQQQGGFQNSLPVGQSTNNGSAGRGRGGAHGARAGPPSQRLPKGIIGRDLNVAGAHHQSFFAARAGGEFYAPY